MRRSVRKPLAVLTVAAISSLIGLGAASWTYVGTLLTTVSIGTNSVKPVCYVNFAGSSEKTYYSSVAKALSVANANSTSDVIAIIPGADAKLESDATLNSSDRLVLPLDEDILTLRASTSDDDDSTSYINYISSSSVDVYTKIGTSSESSVIKCSLSIDEKVTLTVNGQLDVGGAIGYYSGTSSQRPCSWTNNEAAKIVLGNGSNIDVQSGGQLNCYGFIVQEAYGNGGMVTLQSGAKAVEPFTIYDFGGIGDVLNNINYGRFMVIYNMVNGNKEKTSPFNCYSFHNISSLRTLEGSSLIGDCLISSTYSSSLALVPNSISLVTASSGEGMFRLSNGARLDILVNPSSETAFSLGSGLSGVVPRIPTASVTIEGGSSSLNPIEINVKQVISVSIETDDLMLSIPSNLNILLVGTNCTLSQGIKLMPKALISVDSSSTLTISKQSISYTRYNNANESDEFHTLDYSSDNFKRVYPYSSTNTSTFINNGTLNLNAAFAGNVTTEASGAKINVISSTVSITTHEYHRGGLSADSYTDMTITESLRYNDSTKLEASSSYVYENGAYGKQ